MIQWNLAIFSLLFKGCPLLREKNYYYGKGVQKCALIFFFFGWVGGGYQNSFDLLAHLRKGMFKLIPMDKDNKPVKFPTHKKDGDDDDDDEPHCSNDLD